MEFDELARNRRSVRAFRPEPVPGEKLDAVLRAANAAPSAGDLQAYEVVKVTEPARRQALARASHNQEFVAEAPVVLVFFANPARSAPRYGERGEELYSVQDATIACTFAHLAAADLGLGSVWVGAFDDASVARAVGAPAGLKPVAVLPIGVPAELPRPTPRRKLADLVRDESF